MRIAHLCTFWPITGGLTHYADTLIQGMRASSPERHIVLGEIGSLASETEAYECLPCYRRDEDYVDSIVAAARAKQVELLVIQYANDLFGDDNRLPRLLAALRGADIKTVVNAHSVYPASSRTHYEPGRTAGDFDRAVGANASLITVHSQRMKSDLVSHGLSPDRIAVIPHGTPTMTALDSAESRAELELPADAKIVLFFGFIWPGKGIDFLLKVFRDVQAQVPEAFLLVAGHTRRRLWGSYVNYLRLRARLMGLASHSRFWGRYVAEDEVAQVYSAADLVAMPYVQEYSSASGVVHQTAAMGKLMLCSRIAKFDEVETGIDSALTAPPCDRAAWTDAMVRLLRDETMGEQLKSKIRDFAEATSWANVGKMHWEHYARVMAEGQDGHEDR
jgi:glycosyltransferase involved in cell wall biosynthesis